MCRDIVAAASSGIDVFFSLAKKELAGEDAPRLCKELREVLVECVKEKPWWDKLSYYAKCVYCIDTLLPLHESVRGTAASHLLRIMLPALYIGDDFRYLHFAEKCLSDLLSRYHDFCNTEGRFAWRVDAFWTSLLESADYDLEAVEHPPMAQLTIENP